MKKLIETLNAVESKGAFGFVAVTTQEALKKSRTTKEPTPARYVTMTTYRACTVSLGNDYEAVVNARLIKEDLEPDFQAQATYCMPVAPNRLVYKHKNNDTYYLRVYPNLCHSFKSVIRYFDAEGTELGAERWKEIQAEYFKLPSKNESQGLDNPVLVNNYKLENVKFLKRGEIILDELTTEIIKITSKK